MGRIDLLQKKLDELRLEGIYIYPKYRYIEECDMVDRELVAAIGGIYAADIRGYNVLKSKFKESELFTAHFWAHDLYKDALIKLHMERLFGKK